MQMKTSQSETRADGNFPHADTLEGKRLRDSVPRDAHDLWQRGVDRDPIAILEQTNLGRIPALVRIRHGRMLESPLAFLRGARMIMAHDLGFASCVL